MIWGRLRSSGLSLDFDQLGSRTGLGCGRSMDCAAAGSLSLGVQLLQGHSSQPAPRREPQAGPDSLCPSQIAAWRLRHRTGGPGRRGGCQNLPSESPWPVGPEDSFPWPTTTAPAAERARAKVRRWPRRKRVGSWTHGGPTGRDGRLAPARRSDDLRPWGQGARVRCTKGVHSPLLVPVSRQLGTRHRTPAWLRLGPS